MRISDWSSDVCSSDLVTCRPAPSRRRAQPHPITPSKERTMYDHKMNRMTARVTFGRPAPTEAPADLITSVPTAAEAAALIAKPDDLCAPSRRPCSPTAPPWTSRAGQDRKSDGQATRVSVGLDLGGRRL